MDIRKTWWELTGCGTNFCSDVIDALKKGSSVVITGSAALPWPETFYDKLRNAGVSSTKAFEFIKAPADRDPAEYLFNNYCSSSVQTKYWPQPPSYTHVHFLAETDNILLNQRIIIVSSFASERDFVNWCDFAENYCRLTRQNGADTDKRAVFVIENSCSRPFTVNLREIKNICFSPGDVDILTYNLLNTSAGSARYMANKYAAELIGELCRGNIEKCGLLADRTDLITAPVSVFKEFMLWQGADMPAMTDEQIASAVSLAQLKVFFPLIEQKRRTITEKYYSVISGLLPWENDYREIKIEPYDMELRDLIYKAKEINMELKDRELVSRLRDIRNDLAHNHILSFFDVDYLIDL